MRTIYVLVETRNDTDETGRWNYGTIETAAATGRMLAGWHMPLTCKDRTETLDKVFADLITKGRASIGQYDWVITEAEVN